MTRYSQSNMMIEVKIDSLNGSDDEDFSIENSRKKDEDNWVLNPYTGILEGKVKYPEVEYLDLDNVPDKSVAKPKGDTAAVKNEGVKSRKKKKRLWRETNKQEWLNIYQQYMQERLHAKLTCGFSIYTPKRGRKSKEAKSNCANSSVDYAISGQKKRGRRRKVVEDNIRGRNNEIVSDTDDGVRGIKAEYKEECEPVKKEPYDPRQRDDHDEFLDTEFLSVHEDDEDLNNTNEQDNSNIGETAAGEEAERRARAGRPRARAMDAALRAVADGRTGLLNAARLYGVSLDGLCARVHHQDSLYSRKRRTALIMAKGNLRFLRHNSFKLIQNSNICLFKWVSEFYACFVCHKRFKHMPTLRVHAENAHNFYEVRASITTQEAEFNYADITDLECSRCHVMIDTLGELRHHLKQKHGVKFQPDGSLLVPYKLCSDAHTCQLCGEALDSMDGLQSHMQEHFLNHECDECGVGFPNPRALKLHRTQTHVECECSVCGMTLQNLTLKKNHEYYVHGVSPAPAQPRFKCPHCPERFKYDYKRMRHLIEEHDQETDFFQCSFCPKMFLTVYWCTKHMNIVHRGEMSNM